jgi:hypothetical protein
MTYNKIRALIIKYLMKIAGVAGSQVTESPIDERFRLIAVNRYLKSVKEVPVASGLSKWVFCCPFCSAMGRTEAKRNERKGVLLWNDLQHSWVFFCAKKRSPQCSDGGKTLEKFLNALDGELAEQYRIERWHSGTTGKGHSCGTPKSIARVSAGSYGPYCEIIVGS